MTSKTMATTAMLVSLRRGRDDPAWDVFVERYQPILVGVARHLGLGAEDALDVTQQTLLEFVRDFQADRYDRSRGRLRHWVLGILRHRVADLQRMHGRERRHARSVGEAPPAAIDGVPADVIEGAWQREVDRRMLEDALQSLREQTRVSPQSLKAFELTAIRGVPAEAAASACGMSVDGVYVARSRVAARLRQILSDIERAYAEEFP